MLYLPSVLETQTKIFLIHAPEEVPLINFLDANLKPIQGRFLPISFTNKTFYSEGAFVKTNYHSKKLKSVFYVRYEQFNLNNIVEGEQRSFHLLMPICLMGQISMVKVSFYNIDSKEVIDPFGYKKEIRIGWQVIL